MEDVEFQHPGLKEGFTDRLYRFVNEMVFLSLLTLTGFSRINISREISAMDNDSVSSKTSINHTC